MKKWMNQPHYHKHGWAKYDEAQAEIDNLESRLANALSGKTQQAEIDKYKKLIDQIETACDYTNSADNIQLLINDHKGE